MMKKNSLLMRILCIALISTISFLAVACKKPAETPENPQSSEENQADVTVIGEGQTVFTFNVKDKDGAVTSFEVHTDEKTVGAALLKVELVAGDESEYGLYVKTVNGITADYDKDQSWWGFFIDGEMAATGVDGADIEEGKVYSMEYQVG